MITYLVPSLDEEFDNIIFRYVYSEDTPILYYNIFEDQQPCEHKYCRNHVMKPCDVCGRKGSRGKVIFTNDLVYIHNYSEWRHK